jgi:hypothetical protein
MICLRDIDAQAVKVHLDAHGSLWVADGLAQPVPLSDLRRLPDLLANKTKPRLRMLGLARQADLIVRVYWLLREHAPGTQFELAAPQTCETAAELNDGSITLYRMRQCWWPGNVGGWHVFADTDLAAYQLIVNPQCQELRRKHPAWRPLLFLTGIDHEQCVKLLNTIVDPRWFIDRSNAERVGPLVKYLGAEPYTMLRGRGPSYDRFRLTTQAWQGHCSAAQPPSGAGAFVWRRYFAAGGGSAGLLRATQAFIGYLSRSWRQRILQASGQPLEIFQPELLLNASEVLSYRYYMQPG